MTWIAADSETTLNASVLNRFLRINRRRNGGKEFKLRPG
jgi:hypothetical protein